MMLRKTLFALSAVLLLGATAACGDDDKDKDKDTGGDNGDNGDNGDDQNEGAFCDQEENKDDERCKRDNARDELVHSYVSGLALPKDDCCWDYVSNNNEDPEKYQNGVSGLLNILPSVAPDIDLDEVLEDLFVDGTLTLLLEYKDLVEDLGSQNGALDITLFLGESESGADERLGGEGVFTKGVELTDITGSVYRGVIEADAEVFPLSLDLTGFVDPAELEELSLPEVISIDLSGVHLQLLAEEVENGLENDISVTRHDGKSINFLSGVITAETLVDVVNNLVGKEMCGIDKPLLSYTTEGVDTEDADPQNPASPILEATPDAEDLLEEAGEENSVCGDIAEFVGFIGMVSGLLDVDLDGDLIADGMSIGVNLGVTGAIIE